MTPTTNTASTLERPAARPAVTPHYRVEEIADAYVITADVPGASAAEVETIVDGEKLVVNARRTWTAPEGWTPVYREIAGADHRLVLQLDRRVNRDAIKAQLAQGVLTLTLPKSQDAKPRKIEISG